MSLSSAAPMVRSLRRLGSQGPQRKLTNDAERPAPEWSEVEHVRDGRERQGHNPAIEIRDIMHEDWLAVKARDNFVSREVLGRLRLPKRGGDRAALARL